MRDETILIIEDDDLNLKLVESLLELGRYRVLKAMDAETGISLMREHSPDLVLMDIRLPGMDGLQATRLIKQDPELRDIPVIALTAQAMVGDEADALRAGCSGYFSKPIDTRSFLATLQSFIGERKKKSEASKRIQFDRKARILVVDDDPLNVKLLTAKLESAEYDTIEAYSGQEGLDKAVTESPDLLLLDVMMPNMDGFEVTRRLKSDPITSHIPIILVTALDEKEGKARGLEAGADDFLNKPIKNIELQARVRSLVDLKRYRDQVSDQRQVREQLGPTSQHSGLCYEREHIPTVILVEDDETEAQMIQYYLDGEPLQVQLYTDGETALKRVREGKVDLILLDILLPDMNGFEVCRLLKENEETRDIQILVVTCLGDLESKLKGIEIGADDYLVKPIDEKELKARIRWLLEKKCYLDSLALAYGTDDIRAIRDEWGANEKHFNRTKLISMKDPEEAAEDFSSVEAHETAASRKRQHAMASTMSSSEEKPGPANITLDHNTLDQIAALEQQGSSKNLLGTLINTYLDTAPVLLEQLHRVAHQHNSEGLRETAHKLQSSSANLGALTLASLSKELEIAARTNSIQNATVMVSRIEREYQRVSHALTEVLKTRNIKDSGQGT